MNAIAATMSLAPLSSAEAIAEADCSLPLYSGTIASNSALKFPLPKLFAPLR